MYRNNRVAIVVPAYNEEKLIRKTVETMPGFIDHIFVVNDGSTDDTLAVLQKLNKKIKKLHILENPENKGVGYSVTHGFTEALKSNSDLIGVMAGDAQCNPDYVSGMIDSLLDNSVDYVKANRFFHLQELKQMPLYRRIGNIFITILGKFATGYYSIFDSQNGYGIFKRQTLEGISFNDIGQRYDYENTLLIALSISGARIKDHPVPAIYGEEVSTIKFLPTAIRALKVLHKGFWRRIYYKYIVFNFHPIALFFLSGLLLNTVGTLLGIYITFERIVRGLSPTSGTVMLFVLPIIVGLQLILTAISMDMNNEKVG